MYKVLTTYKFVELKNLEKLKDEIKSFCKANGIFGRILIGEEGINAGFCGSEESVNEFKLFLEDIFGKLTYRELNSKVNPYPKLQVKIRNEIVVFGEKVDVSKTCPHLEPEEVRELFEKEKDLVVIDTRNDYETEIGKFENAIDPKIKTFKDFPKWVSKQEHLKDKKVLIYCTGGIRCEKAGAYMKDIGFKDVNQIQGGIINYCQKYPGKNWEGSLFVFDDRLASDMKSGKPIADCKHCGEKTLHSTNCANVECNKIFPCCEKCLEKFENCCCEECVKAENKRELLNVFEA